MTREEIVNSREYQVAKAAVESFYAGNDGYTKGFENGAEWADEHPNPEIKKQWIEKACEFIRTPCIYVVDFNKNGGATTNYEATVEKFLKYMEE